MLFGSVTDLGAEQKGCHVVVGSHGARSTGAYAARAGVASLICHDAGGGLDGAGVAGLALLDDAGIAAIAVANLSARIGDPADILARGRVSAVNRLAERAGVAPGMAVTEAAVRLRAAASGERDPAPKRSNARPSDDPIFVRTLLPRASGLRVVLADSASLIVPDDRGAIAVTGSHGGLPGNAPEKALKAPLAFAVFNDAGGGIDEAGIARLPVLDVQGIAAVCIDFRTARIGEAQSTYETGIVSVANVRAHALGVVAGMSVPEAIAQIEASVAVPTGDHTLLTSEEHVEE